MKRELPPLTFATSIMCRWIGISADGFYGGMREDVNLYTAPDTSVLNLHNFNSGKLKTEDCRMDGDLDKNLPLIIAFDANANINWLVVGQVGRDGRLRVIKSFFVKYERKIPELLDDFLAYYAYHKRHQAIFYYDATFVGNNYGIDGNGGVGGFTPEEAEQLSGALCDLADHIRRAAKKINAPVNIATVI